MGAVQEGGGLVCSGFGTVLNSYAEVHVIADFGGGAAGGLLAINNGTVSQSFATGAVKAKDGAYVGGLVGDNSGTIEDSYSTGAISISGYGAFTGLLSDLTLDKLPARTPQV